MNSEILIYVNRSINTFSLRGSSEHASATKGNEAATRLARRDGIVAWLNRFLEGWSKADDPTPLCAG